jgi:RNase P subunit RPR2
MKKIGKEEIEKLIEKARTAEDWKKIRKLAMSNQVKLGNLRKKFCKNCFHPLKGVTRINKGFKIIKCEYCSKVIRWKLKKVGDI